MKRKEKEKPSLIRLLRYMRKHRGRLITAVVFSILNKIVDLAPPILIGAAVDVVVTKEQSFISNFGIVEVSDQLLILAAVTLVVWGMESGFQYIYSILWRNLAQTIQHELRMDAYAHIQGLEIAYFEDRSTGGLLAILNDDINQLERFLDSGINDLIQVLTTVIIIGGIFIVLVPTVAWMALIPMPFVAWGAVIFQRKIAPRYATVREKNSRLSGHLSNNLSGIATIKSFTAEKYEVEKISAESQAYRESNQYAIRMSSAFVPLIRMIIVVGFAAIMVFGGELAIDGSLNIGAYSILVFMTQRLLWPLTRLGTMLDLYQRAMASTDRVLDVLDTKKKIIGGSIVLKEDDIKGALSFKNVNFTYSHIDLKEGQPAPIAIRNLNIEIPAGESIAVVGPTGAGKSTLVKLMLRFYDVENGGIFLDDVDLRDLNLSDLRGAIGFVSQDVFLFHGTVLENIQYGRFNASMEEVIKAAKMAEAHEFIMELVNGYETIVGERGQKLSGGQRQRISIARAILKNPPILILDEATSSVDNETEAAIQRSMQKIAVGRTTIVIAHRLSTVRNADRIYVLENGELREAGKHEDLLKKQGIYSKLWLVQTGEGNKL